MSEYTTHTAFTEWEQKEGYSTRESIDGPQYDKVIEVRCDNGKTSHIEVRRRSSMWKVSNGPFFTGGVDYVTGSGILSNRTQAELLVFESLK